MREALELGVEVGLRPLARFDGERFDVFDSTNRPELRDRRITCLFEDAGHTLWIGDAAGTITRVQVGGKSVLVGEGSILLAR